MKVHLLGQDNPYSIVKQIKSHRWSIYRKNPLQKIATFPNEFVAYECRRALLKFEGYDI